LGEKLGWDKTMGKEKLAKENEMINEAGHEASSREE